MLRFIKNLFPYNAKSIDDFVLFIQKENCQKVSVYPYTDNYKDPMSRFATFFTRIINYELKATSITPKGRRVFYQKFLFSGLVRNNYGLFIKMDNNEYAIKALLFCEQTMRELQKKLPKLRVNLVNPEDVPMNQEEFDSLHKSAEACKISI